MLLGVTTTGRTSVSGTASSNAAGSRGQKAARCPSRRIRSSVRPTRLATRPKLWLNRVGLNFQSPHRWLTRSPVSSLSCTAWLIPRRSEVPRIATGAMILTAVAGIPEISACKVPTSRPGSFNLLTAARFDTAEGLIEDLAPLRLRHAEEVRSFGR